VLWSATYCFSVSKFDLDNLFSGIAYKSIYTHYSVRCQDLIPHLQLFYGSSTLWGSHQSPCYKALIHNDEIETAIVLDLVGNQVQAIVVRDNKLKILLHHLDTAASLRMVRYNGRPVNDAVAQVPEPSALHD
jgi:hypothetical protein